MLPSIIIDGSTHLQDQRKINLFVKGACADGCGLVLWARAFADLTGLDEQASLLHKVVTAKLRAGSTCEQLRAHASLMLERWACIEKSDRAAPYPYYKYLHASMPALPAGEHLVTVRTWLGERMESLNDGNNEPKFADPDDGIDALVKRAAFLGVPAGTAERAGAMLNLLSDELPALVSACDECDDQGDAVHAMQAPGGGGARKSSQKKRFKPAENDCPFCDAGACFANKNGGASKCICRWNSTFDLKKLESSNARYVKMARKWHEANQSATTLKGVRFTVRPAGAAGGGAMGITYP